MMSKLFTGLEVIVGVRIDSELIADASLGVHCQLVDASHSLLCEFLDFAINFVYYVFHRLSTLKIIRSKG